MNRSNPKINSIIAGAFAVAITGTAVEASAASKEKCYGVVKAGHNGCGDASGKHSCQGAATEDGSGQEWIALPQGICEKLVGGSLEPFESASKHSCGAQGCNQKDS